MASRASTWIDFAAVVRRSLLPRPYCSSQGALHQNRNIPRANAHRTIQNISGIYCQATTRPFTTTLIRQETLSSRSQDAISEGQEYTETPQAQSLAAASRNKSPRSNAASTSLRRVAVDAQRSRDTLIKGHGRRRHIDPSSPTKVVTAYCAAEAYTIPIARELLRTAGYTTDPLPIGLGEQVLHVRTSDQENNDGDTAEGGDIFVFPSGSVVGWNVPDRTMLGLVERVLPEAAENTHLNKIEMEDMQYIELESNEASEIIGDTIVLGTKAPESHPSTSMQSQQQAAAEIDAILAKIAYSSALARSTKLAVLENSLSTYFASTRSIPTTLSTGRPLRLTRRFVLRKTGELLSIRAQLNLYSELTDSLPDLFWDSPHALGLESYYDSLGRALDVGVRIKVLNEKMDYASEIAAVLRERLSERHSAGLEWLIIALISIEVGFGIIHLWREGKEAGEVERVRSLLEQYLEKEMQGRAREG